MDQLFALTHIKHWFIQQVKELVELEEAILKHKGQLPPDDLLYAIEKDKLYVLEANPRASRTVPLVSKVCNVQMANVATQLMLGKKLPDMALKARKVPHFGVKESVFPFDKMPEVDPVLGPEMALASVKGIAAQRKAKSTVRSLQEYHREIKG